MKRFAVCLLLVSIATGLPFQTGTYLRSAWSSAPATQREEATYVNIKPNRENSNKNVNFISVANFCASHPFAGGCEFDEKVQRSGILEDHLSERNNDESDYYEEADRQPSLLTVAFFCASHPSAIGCPDVKFDANSGDFYNVKILPDIMVRFCILHPSSYGCPKLGLVSSLPALPSIAPLPTSKTELTEGNTKQNLTEFLPETFQTVIQPNDVKILTEYFDSERDLTYDAASLIAAYNDTDGNNETSSIGYVDQFLREELTEITGRSVGDAPVSETNDLLSNSETTPDESSQTLIQSFESTKVTKPKATWSLPPPVDAIFAAGRYAWQKPTTPTPPASPAEVSKRLKMGKMNPLPSVKQLLGSLAL